MQTHYEINVSRLSSETNRYHHFFVTAQRSGISRPNIERVYKELVARFHAPEFKVSCTLWQASGMDVNFKEG